MKKLLPILLVSALLQGCIVSSAVSVAKDVAVGTVDIATDVVGTGVDIVKPKRRR